MEERSVYTFAWSIIQHVFKICLCGWDCPLFFCFFFTFFFTFFFFLIFKFTIFYWFCHISKWIRHRYTCVAHPEPSSLLPPHTIPLGRHSAPAPSIQYRASNLDWRLVSYMILYMFQCHSPWGNQNWKRHMYPNVHRSTVYNSQDMEAT